MRKNQKIALLRGINVGGKNKLKMADLKDSLHRVGLLDVRTYIQSGNICFGSADAPTKLEAEIKNVIRDDFGYDVPVLVMSQSFFEKVIADSPYCENGAPLHDVKELHVTLLATKPTAKSIARFDEISIADDYRIIKDVIYLRCPDGYSKTKMTNGFIEKKLGTQATTRNWKTICKLAAM